MRSGHGSCYRFGALLVVIGFCMVPVVCAGDWANWRGPNYNGISDETDWEANFPEGGPKKLWSAPLGTGFSSITVSKGRAYAMGNTSDTDNVFCFDAETGKEIWKKSYAEKLEPRNYEGGTSSTPTVVGGKVYTLSKSGKAYCFDAVKGDVVWMKDLQAEFGCKMPTWGFAGSAFIDGDVVVFNAGKWGIALKTKDGSKIWDTGKDKSGYATAVPFERDGKKYLAVFGSKGIAGIDPKTGAVVWESEWETRYDVNAADPVIVGDKVFIASGYGHGCQLLQIKGNAATELWQNKNMKSQMNGAVYKDGYFYGINQKELVCLDMKTGDEMWADKCSGNGSVMLADGKLIILSDKGELFIAEATPKEFKVISSAKILSGKCWTVPVLANGRIYARSNKKGEIVCLDVKKK